MRGVILALQALVASMVLTICAAPVARADGGTPGMTCAYGVCTVSGGAASKDRNTAPGAATCSWRGKAVPCESEGKTFDPASGCYQGPPDAIPPAGPVLAQFKQFGGSILYATCPFGGSGGYVWVPPAKPVVTAAMVRAQVVRFIPTAAVGVAPKGTSLVNIETVLWAAAPERQDLAAVQILGQRVVISLRLNDVSWQFGDGAVDPNGPAGRAYDSVNDPCRQRDCPQYYGHTYRRVGPVVVSATANWRASFTVDGGAIQDGGDVPGPTSSANITIKQARAVLVPNPGQQP